MMDVRVPIRISSWLGTATVTVEPREPVYRIDKNPLPWMEEMLNGVEHTNFFENRATEYSKAATRGTWEEPFEQRSFLTVPACFSPP